MDAKAAGEFLREYAAIRDVWPDPAMAIIRERNPEMYSRMGKITDEIEKMIARGEMSKTERQRFKELLAAWKRIHELGIGYAARHMKT